MSLLVLAAATVVEHAPAAHAAGGGNPLELLNQFGVELKYVIWQLISFSLLAFVLYRFAIKPVLATMDERNAKIEAGLKNAEATAARLAEAQNSGGRAGQGGAAQRQQNRRGSTQDLEGVFRTRGRGRDGAGQRPHHQGSAGHRAGAQTNAQ
jgi:hypothetical protein